MKSTEGINYGTFRKNATIAGILYILGTVFTILSVIFTQPVANAQDYFVVVTANENRVIIGALFISLMGLALAMVPVVLYPILKKVNEVFALGFVVIRGALETVTYFAMTVCWLLMTSFAQGYAGASSASAFQNLGASLLHVQDTINLILIIVFSLGALMLYTMLYTSKLVPRWISIWGVIAILLHLSTSFLGLFGLMTVSMSGDTMSGITFVLDFPIFLQEMVMAVWLIVRGFNSLTLASEPV
jgi:hypothetical protein